MVPHRPELDRPEGEGELGLTERRRSRTYRAVGCTTALVLKTSWATGPMPLRCERTRAKTARRRTGPAGRMHPGL